MIPALEAHTLDSVFADPAEFTRTVRSLLAGAHDVVFEVAGRSMTPALHPGDAVRVTPCHHPRPGDLCLFARNDGSCVLHRFVLRDPRHSTWGRLGFLGDAPDSRPDWVPPECILGRVTAIHRGPEVISLTSPAARARSCLTAIRLLLRHLLRRVRRF